MTKIPRFAFEKFPGASSTLTTSMKSVGEVMAIGRTFEESLQKALRSMETGLTGLDDYLLEGGLGDDKNVIRAALGAPAPDRILKVAQALRLGFDHEQIYSCCRIDPWFVAKLQTIVDAEAKVREHGLPGTAQAFRELKAMGFSDTRLANLARLTEAEVAAKRRSLGVFPVYKRIDTCAAEFPSPTAYMYSTYENALGSGDALCEANPSEREKIVILGSGPNRIGQGIEFDYCCCHAAFSLSKAGYETIMVNCNPETVSTDYDTSDRLYFEPLTPEDVLAVIEKEASRGKLKGVIVQFGGQTPLKLAQSLDAQNVPILGTSPDAIDLAEDRDRFKALVEKLNLRQPKNGIAYSVEQALLISEDIGFPIVVRPSYVLGGRAMAILPDQSALKSYFETTLAAFVPPDLQHRFAGNRHAQVNAVLAKNALLLDSYVRDAIEVDVDAICDGEDVFIAGVMEHIEEAGVHSGDSACSLPPHSLCPATLAGLERQTADIALALNVVGLMNVQYAIKGEDVYVLEVNPRASRTVPFVVEGHRSSRRLDCGAGDGGREA